MSDLMGYEKYLAYGAAGSQAASQLSTVRDVKYEIGNSQGETTPGGDGSAPPIESFRVTSRTMKLTFTMINKTSDTSLAAMIVAAAAGDPVALYFKDRSAGKGYDGDVNLTASKGLPYKGEQTIDFEATINREAREPSLNAS